MGRLRGWAADQTERAPMRSPGWPGVNQQDTKRAFWERIAAGLSSEDAASACGVSQPVGTRWFREAGGMAPISLVPHSGRYLSFAEREELALLRAQRYGVREIARRLGRSPSTVSRELRRHAATRGGTLTYRATVAQWKAERAAKRPKTVKLAENERLRAYVQARLAGAVTDAEGRPIPGPNVPWKGRRHGRRADRRWGSCWSPEQISRRLRIDFPHDATMRISHEAIYQALYVQGRGARCNANCPRVCAPAGRCGCHVPGGGNGAKTSSPPR
jgi:transposase